MPFIITGTNSSSSIAIWWVASAGASSYQLERTINGLHWELIATTGLTQSYFTDTGLLAGTWHMYRVRAANAGGIAPPSLTSIACTLSQIADWRLANFGTMEPSGAAASGAVGPDGIANLVKFAFKMSITDGVQDLVPGIGQAGLPHVCVDPATRRLRVEFVRRKWAANPGVSYEVQFSSDLVGFVPEGAAVQITPIDSVWERVVWEDIVSAEQAASRFVRVRLIEIP